MNYTRNKLEQIVIGTLLNEYGYSKFYTKSKSVLNEDLFIDKRNKFIFAIIKEMIDKGIKQTTPYDVAMYATQNNKKYGNLHMFCCYMCDVIQYNALGEFKRFVKQLVDEFVKDKRYGKER